MVRLSSFLLFLLLPLSAFAASNGPFVMGPPAIPAFTRAAFLHAVNPAVDLATALNFSLLYDEEARYEGVNPDVAFAQMLLETSFLRFGGQVSKGQNNFAGLGALDGGHKGLAFASPRLGIRAQIQHLKYYATNLPLEGKAINPRLSYIKRASAPTVYQLSMAWASDPEYGNKLAALLQRMEAHVDRPAKAPARGPLPTVASPAVPGN